MKRQKTPVGGKLVDRVLEGQAKEKALQEAKKLPSLIIDRETAVQLEMLATGVLSPHQGFIGKNDYQSVLDRGRLANGIPWTLPTTFSPLGSENEKVALGLQKGEKVALRDKDETLIGLFHFEERFKQDKDERAQKLFGTKDRAHPGVDHIYRNMGDTLLSGPIDLVERQDWGPFEKYRLPPKEAWKLFDERKWGTVVAFQTANPIHRGHEYLQKCALEIYDGLFINPIVETTRRAYFRNEFRLKGYEAAVDNYYPKDRVMLAALRVTMNYAGPKEAILHALIRRNFGCTHFIVGRDHAGFRNFYDPYASQRIFDDYDSEELGIEPVFFQESFFCTRCGNMGSSKTCPHGREYHITMSGTAIQDIIRYGYVPPKEVMRPEVTQIASQGIQPKGVGPDGKALKGPGETVKGLFPYYLTHYRLGGYSRKEKLDPAKMTLQDLETSLSDARENASRIYEDIYNEFIHFFDVSRNVTVRQKAEALAEALRMQEDLVKTLEEKIQIAEDKVKDPFMYQDKEEAKKELEVAKRILSEIGKPLSNPEVLKERIWNPMNYTDYSI